jgi:hypothetical protein
MFPSLFNSPLVFKHSPSSNHLYLGILILLMSILLIGERSRFQKAQRPLFFDKKEHD